MDVQEGKGFGWSLPLRGRAPEEIARELDGIRRQVDALIDVYFPKGEGYARSAAEAGTHGSFEGLGVVIDRGDFRAEVAFECVSPRDPGAPAWVRLCGRSESRALVRARDLGIGAAETLRWVMGAVGLVIFASMLSLLLVVPPHFSVETLFVLGGLLMVVVAVLTVVSAVSIGAWMGERVADLLNLRAMRQVAADDDLRKDFQRWRSLTRQMMAKRSLLSGDLRRLPFRHERETWSAGDEPAFLSVTA
jgi:hypothetical protein